MKGSQELIAFFNKREEELGEKASKLNMFLEGYAEGCRDTKAYMIDKACEYLKEQVTFEHPDYRHAVPLYDNSDIEAFRKYMEE